MVDPQEGYVFKNDNKIALDNNALHSAFGLDARIHALAKQTNISVEDVMKYYSIKALYGPKVSKTQLKLLDALYQNLKLSYKKELRIVITPTVLSEVHNKKIVFTPIKPNLFFQNYSVEHVAFDEHEQRLIDELTKDLLSPQKVTLMKHGFPCQKTERPFDGNKNANHDHDARIFAESIFAGVNLFTFDRDFEKKELIYHTVKEFEKKHPETKGISNFKILPDIQQCNTQDQYIFEK